MSLDMATIVYYHEAWMHRTAKLIPDILKLAKEGIVDKVIAERLRCSESYVGVARRRNGIYYKSHQRKHKGKL